MRFVEHPLIRKETLQSRLYQEAILGRAVKTDLLCVLPTGLGKTPIAIVLTAHRMEKFPDSKILILAPTKPLIEQHLKSFRNTINLPENEFVLLTGMIKPEERMKLYEQGKLIFATPQTIKNDLESERISLSKVSLIVFDEAHHSIGDYAYPYIARKYLEEGENPRILGLTASPGGTKEKIREICKNLGIKSVEIRTEEDQDVRPYVKRKEIEWVRIDLPESFKEIRKYLEKAYYDRLSQLRKFGITKPIKIISKKDLLGFQQKLQEKIREGRRKYFWGVSLVSQAIKIEHSLGLLETQGIKPLEEYFRKLRSEDTRSARNLIRDKNISQAMLLTEELFSKGSKHPKVSRLCEVVEQQLKAKKNSKIIVFANYRNTVKELVNILRGVENARPIEFMGQREGFTQKEQKRRLNEFKSGEYNILVTTSVGEEGIHVAEADIAIFYEPVPSEIRQVQRRGRVGRTKLGKVIILITKKTRDEAYYWTSVRKERVMKRTLYEMRGKDLEEFEGKKKGQLKLEDF
jgi:Fanconi anemia group M protein